MAMTDFAQNLQEELTCPVCLEYFTHPVTLGCGHSFCHLCLLRSGGEADQPCPCPECRRAFLMRDLEPNHRLGKLANIVKNIRPQLLQLKRESTICEKHQEEQKLFCEEDQTFLCVPCAQTQEHRTHSVLLMEKAAENSRDKLQRTMDLLWKEVEKTQKQLAKHRKKMKKWDEQKLSWKKSIRVEFKSLIKFLKREEKQQLDNFMRDENQSMNALRENEMRLSQYLQRLREVINDLDQNGQKPDHQLLQVVGSTLKRCQSLLSKGPEAVPIQIALTQVTGIWEMMKLFTVNVTLDPESASPFLIVSEDLKTVTHGGYQQNTPDALCHHEDSIILGVQVFTNGMHYWEVDVGDSKIWAVGLCKASMSTRIPLHHRDVFLLKSYQKGNTYSVKSIPLNLKHKTNSVLRKIGIFINYKKGAISFYDALEGCLIIRFPVYSFSEPLKPIFCPCPPMGEENGIPMIINP